MSPRAGTLAGVASGREEAAAVALDARPEVKRLRPTLAELAEASFALAQSAQFRRTGHAASSLAQLTHVGEVDRAQRTWAERTLALVAVAPRALVLVPRRADGVPSVAGRRNERRGR